MQQKAPDKNFVNPLYEFAEEISNFGSMAEKKRLAEASIDATAAQKAMSQWRENNGKKTNSAND
jgi:hypothetical protein